jgi:hypothetical protein
MKFLDLLRFVYNINGMIISVMLVSVHDRDVVDHEQTVDQTIQKTT